MRCKSLRPLCLLSLVSLMVVALCGAQDDTRTQGDAAGDTEYRILVTNDDGIRSPGLIELVKTLSADAEVIVCAPDANRSGASQSVPSLARPMTVRSTDVPGAARAFAVSGSPADAVCYAVVELGKDRPFDLVVSGINSSANVGDLSHSSGTVGAAMEGVYRGIPAVAVSRSGRNQEYQYSAQFAARFVKKLRSTGPQKGIVYSINVPGNDADRIKGVAVRPMGGSMISVQGYRSRDGEDGEKVVQSRLSFERQGPSGSDCEAFFDGYITITPLKFDWTAHETLKELRKWKLTAE